jgi:xanthine dehydrogenase YagT iron-sulfur-binding subunit
VHPEINRRTFVVGASITAGGAVVAGSLLSGCESETAPAQGETSVVRLRINGEDKEIAVDNRTSLLDMLRERAGLTGTKKGCDQGACGYCTSGQIMSGLGCIAERHAGSDEEIREWMSGNICRCGAYTNIVAAIAGTAKEI